MTWKRTVVEPGAVLAWYCNHEDESYDQRTHIAKEIVKGQWVTRRRVNTISAMSHGHTKPPCPRAVPLRARKRDLDLATPRYPEATA